MDDLTKRRFDRIAASVNLYLEQFEEALRKLNESGMMLEALLGRQLDGIGRISGETAQIREARERLAHAYSKFLDPGILPALDAAKDEFDECAIEVARIVGSLP